MSNLQSPLSVVKISGKIIDDSKILHNFLCDFLDLQGYKILIHGGGKQIDVAMAYLGITTNKVDGIRITDLSALSIMLPQVAVLNTQIAYKLDELAKGNVAEGIPALGSYVYTNKMPPKKVNGEMVDFQYVGSKVRISEQVEMSVKAGKIPVIPPFAFAYDINANVNINADHIASLVAAEMAENYSVSLVYCSDVPGVLFDINNPASVVKKINPSKYNRMKEDGIISKGMIPKLDSAFNSLKHGVKEVKISNGLRNIGTIITNQITR
ncbi:MAG: hypothetical protein LBB23_01035 [Rickettsiales bacterium]|jgi:acetylglutamate kinase|nr:hypothetical protein [Rickettsiales bacterium]